MEESAVYLKYSGQGFAHDAIAQALLQSRSPFGHWQSQSRLLALAFHCDLQNG
jgi:hypothetical protein